MQCYRKFNCRKKMALHPKRTSPEKAAWPTARSITPIIYPRTNTWHHRLQTAPRICPSILIRRKFKHRRLANTITNIEAPDDHTAATITAERVTTNNKKLQVTCHRLPELFQEVTHIRAKQVLSTPLPPSNSLVTANR